MYTCTWALWKLRHAQWTATSLVEGMTSESDAQQIPVPSFFAVICLPCTYACKDTQYTHPCKHAEDKDKMATGQQDGR